MSWSVTLPGAPTAATNGWSPTGLYYAWIPTDGTQTWAFSTPVNLSFTVTNLQNVGEGVTLPPGTTCDPNSVGTAWSFDPATAVLVYTPLVASASVAMTAIPCTLNNTMALTVDNAPGGPTNWWRGLHSITATPATLQAQFSGLPSSMLPGQTAHGTLTCSNAGPGPDALNAACTPSIASGGGTISNIVCTPPSPVGTLHDGQSIVCTFDLTAPNTPTVSIDLTGKATATGLDATATANAGMTARLVLLSPTAAAVPTLGEWALLLLGLAMLGMAGLYRKRGV